MNDQANQHLKLVTADDKNPRPQRSPWKLTKEAFDAVLEAFDADRDAATDLYLRTRRDLTYFFEGRGFPEGADHADEVFDRAARRLESGEQVVAMRSYLFGIARFVLLELNRGARRQSEIMLESARHADLAAIADTEDDRIAALRECLVKIGEEDRLLVLRYYNHPENDKAAYRERLAAEHSAKIAGLRVKIQRLRNKLETCVGIVMKKRQMFR